MRKEHFCIREKNEIVVPILVFLAVSLFFHPQTNDDNIRASYKIDNVEHPQTQRFGVRESGI